MALYRRKDAGIWYADFYVDGQRVQESTGTANTREAEVSCLAKLRGAAWRVCKTHTCSAAGIVGAIFRLRQDAQAILETGRADVREPSKLSWSAESGFHHPSSGGGVPAAPRQASFSGDRQP